ncbi:uncharacterized protein LOC130714218 isoform X2 [Lotus japonicus]|uniref:uncharacterized protein LOC130714218 isoform X2 n=1 Tax=Lotus japonicus TaxID=34305 RepID=UPI00258F7495|nr:uncharacterized protein LOC130714218 isoform X2 [Lotus japonicus]
MEEVPSSSAAGVSATLPPSATARPKLQRYALRSAAKSKEHNPDAPNRSISPQSKRGTSVSRSVGVLDFSGKDRSSSAKPPRRLSISTKGSTTPSLKMVGSITPTSETRTRRSGNGQGPPSRSQTPVSEIFRTSSRMKFNLISSASYWLNQIKLSESAAKHSISLGFFKLALEAGCEPFLKLQDELKSYVSRHQLAELGEPVKELLESYNIAENIVLTQVSESISQVPEEGTQSSDDEVHCCSSSTMADEKLKPKCLDTDSTQLSPEAIESTKKEACQKSNPSSRLRGSLRMNSANSRLASDRVNRRATKKLEKTNKQETNKEKGEVKKKGKNSEIEEVLFSPTSAEDNVQRNK